MGPLPGSDSEYDAKQLALCMRTQIARDYGQGSAVTEIYIVPNSAFIDAGLKELLKKRKEEEDMAVYLRVKEQLEKGKKS